MPSNARANLVGGNHEGPGERAAGVLQQQPEGRLFLLILLAAFLVALPTLCVGILWDDYDHHNRFAVYGGGFREALATYDNFPGASTPEARAHLPWYVHPDIRISFMRPLAGVSRYLDYVLFGERLIWHHLHSIAWYLAWLTVVGLILRRLLPGRVWLLVLLVIALYPGNFIQVVQIGGRYGVGATALALAGFAAHLRWRMDGWRPGAPLSVLGYGLGVAFAESAVAVFGFPAAYELVRLLSGTGGVWERARANLAGFCAGMAPAVLVAGTWFAVYTLGGYGVRASGMYLDPVATPLEVLRLMPRQLLFALGSYAAGVDYFVFLYSGMNEMRAVNRMITGYAAIGAVFGAVALWIWARVWRLVGKGERDGLSVLLLAGLIGVLPMMVSLPSTRMLMAPSIGLTAFLVVAAWSWRNQAGPGVVVARRGKLFLVGLAAVLGVFVLSWQVQTGIIHAIEKQTERFALEAPLPGEMHEKTVVVIRSEVSSQTNVVRILAAARRPLPARWITLADAAGDAVLEVTDAHTIALAAEQGSLLEGFMSDVLGANNRHFEVGERIDRDAYTATVLELHGGLPSMVSFRFHAPLDSADKVWLVHWDGQLAPAVLPAIGGRLRLSELIPAEN